MPFYRNEFNDKLFDQFGADTPAEMFRKAQRIHGGLAAAALYLVADSGSRLVTMLDTSGTVRIRFTCSSRVSLSAFVYRVPLANETSYDSTGSTKYASQLAQDFPILYCDVWSSLDYSSPLQIGLRKFFGYSWQIGEASPSMLSAQKLSRWILHNERPELVHGLGSRTAEEVWSAIRVPNEFRMQFPGLVRCLQESGALGVTS